MSRIVAMFALVSSLGVASRIRILSALVWVTVLFAAAASFGCVPYVRGQARSAAGGGTDDWSVLPWQAIDRQDAHLHFEMPATPGTESATSRLSDGRRVTRTFGSTRSRTVLFGYIIVDFEMGIGGSLLGELNALVDGNIESAEGSEIVSAEALWSHGYPGTELKLVNEEDAETITMRHYIGRSRAYVFFVAVPRGNEAYAQSGVDRFFSSVVLDPADAPSVDGSGALDFAAPSWRFIAPPEGAFAIEVPGDPRRTQTEVRADDHDFDVYVYSLTDERRHLDIQVSTVDLRGRDPEDIVEVLQTRALEGGTLAETIHGSRGGHAMRRLKITKGDRVRHAMIVGGTGVAHVVTVTYPLAIDAEVAAARDRVLDSFIRP